jgi:hypothetical protein
VARVVVSAPGLETHNVKDHVMSNDTPSLPVDMTDAENLIFDAMLRIEQRLNSIDETAKWFRARWEHMDRIREQESRMLERELSRPRWP